MEQKKQMMIHIIATEGGGEPRVSIMSPLNALNAFSDDYNHGEGVAEVCGAGDLADQWGSCVDDAEINMLTEIGRMCMNDASDDDMQAMKTRVSCLKMGDGHFFFRCEKTAPRGLQITDAAIPHLVLQTLAAWADDLSVDGREITVKPLYRLPDSD